MKFTLTQISLIYDAIRIASSHMKTLADVDDNEESKASRLSFANKLDELTNYIAKAEDRTPYQCQHGHAAWWSKDGAWHIAIPETNRHGFYWTAKQYSSRDEAIRALHQNEGGSPCSP